MISADAQVGTGGSLQFLLLDTLGRVLSPVYADRVAKVPGPSDLFVYHHVLLDS